MTIRNSIPDADRFILVARPIDPVPLLARDSIDSEMIREKP